MTNSERYLRQIALPGFGHHTQERLARAHVVFIGAGGLSSPALQYLAAAGVGQITIVDDDVVDMTNLHRQIVHSTVNLGRPKVHSAAERIAELNPDVTVHAIHSRCDWDVARTLVETADVVFDGTDNFETRHIISAACARAGIPHVWGSIQGFNAQMSVFWAGYGPIYEDLRPEPPEPGVVPTCVQAGVLGPVVGVVGAAMALETVKILGGIGAPMLGTLGYYDGLSSKWQYVPLLADPAVTAHVVTSGPVATEAEGGSR